MLLMLTLPGCSTVSLPVRPVVALPPAFFLAPMSSSEVASLDALLPADDALRQLNVIAQAEAPTLEAAIARIERARAQLRGTRSEQLPNIAGSGSVTGQRIGAQQLNNVPPGVDVDRNLLVLQTGIQASYDFDLFGGLRASRRAAQARLDSAQADARAVRLALTSDLARGVVDWRALADQTMLARDDVAQATTLIAITSERARIGVSSDTDRVRAEALAADARARLAAIASQRAEVLGRLVTLTARPAQEVSAILEATRTPAMGVASRPTALPGLTTATLRSRPDVAAAEARLRAADQDIAAAAAQRFPRLTLSAIVGVAALAIGDLFDTAALTGSLGPTLSGPLLDFGRIGSRIDEAQAAAREAFADYRRATFTALGEAEAAYGQARAADMRTVELKQQVAFSQDAVRLVEIRYRSGLDNFVGVIDARRQAFASRQALAIATGNARASRITLFRALGGAELEVATPANQ